MLRLRLILGLVPALQHRQWKHRRLNPQSAIRICLKRPCHLFTAQRVAQLELEAARAGQASEEAMAEAWREARGRLQEQQEAHERGEGGTGATGLTSGCEGGAAPAAWLQEQPRGAGEG